MKQQIRLCLVRLEQDRHRRVLSALRRALRNAMPEPGIMRQVLEEMAYREIQLDLLRYAAKSAQAMVSKLRKRVPKFQKLV